MGKLIINHWWKQPHLHGFGIISNTEFLNPSRMVLSTPKLEWTALLFIRPSGEPSIAGIYPTIHCDLPIIGAPNDIDI